LIPAGRRLNLLFIIAFELDRPDEEHSGKSNRSSGPFNLAERNPENRLLASKKSAVQ